MDESGNFLNVDNHYVLETRRLRQFLSKIATPLLNTLLGPTLLQERNQILKLGGLRAKIQTNIDDFIDTVLYDRRNIENDGNTLFITSKFFL